MNKKIFYSCEDGKDICIKVFDTLDEAKNYATTDECVKEIFKYVIEEYELDEDDNIECLGCVWKRED